MSETSPLLQTPNPRADEEIQILPPPTTNWKQIVLYASASAVILFGGVVFLLALIPTHTSLSRETKIDNIFNHLENLYNLTKDFPRRSRSMINGYNVSALYIKSQLEEYTDYDVQMHYFPIKLYLDLKPATFSVSSKGYKKEFTADFDFATLKDSGSGILSMVPIKLVRNGCNVADYEDIKPGSIVLLNKDSDCLYVTKVRNAGLAKMGAAILFSPSTLGEPVLGRCIGCMESSMVGFGLSQKVGLELLELLATGNEVLCSLSASTGYKDITTMNVIATTPAGRDDKIIVAGSHLDSVPQGPGMNDDGSGASTTLEIALSLYRSGLSKKVKNKVRFAFWAAEELGLLGSLAYVRDLAKNDPAELKKFALNLNDDMLASPNYARLVYNGREASDPKLKGPSGVIQNVLEGWFDYTGLTHETTPFDGRSDYLGFLEYGIPAGGLFTGAEELKTPEQVAKFGGISGVALDPCYHQACDDLSNVSGPGKVVLEQMASALAYAIERFAFEADLDALLAGEKPIGNPAKYD